MNKKEKTEERHRVSVDIPHKIWVAARKKAIDEDSTPKEVLEKDLKDLYESKQRTKAGKGE